MTASDRVDDHGSVPGPGADGVVRAEYDWSSLAPSTAVIETVATASGREPTALESLFGVIDPDALNTLVRSNGTGTTERGITVTFGFAGYGVTVQDDGVVLVRPGEPRREPE